MPAGCRVPDCAEPHCRWCQAPLVGSHGDEATCLAREIADLTDTGRHEAARQLIKVFQREYVPEMLARRRTQA